VTDFGANGHDLNGDSEAFRISFEVANSDPNRDSIFIPSGTYYLSTPIPKMILKYSITVLGDTDTRIICEQGFGWFMSPEESNIELSKPALRGDEELSFVNTALLGVGDVVCLFADTEVENAWHYPKSDNHRITEVLSEEEILLLNEPLNFDYYPDKEKIIIKIYHTKNIYFQNIEFVLNSKADKKPLMGIRLDGLSCYFNNILIIDPNLKKNNSFIGLYNCNQVGLKDIWIEGAMYGVLINNSRDFIAKDTYVENSVHPYAPATWSDGIFIDSLVAFNASIDAHPSFNVSYKNVDQYSDSQYFNCRALGVTLENCSFSAGSKPKGKVYIGMNTLNPEFKWMMREYDVNIKNVDWVHSDMGYNGLNISSARTLVIEQCTTHAISTTYFCDSILIRNSRIGRFRCYDNNFLILNTLFDGSLLSKESPKYAISVSYSGTSIIDGCDFINYENKDASLINYIHSPLSELIFRNCKIGKFDYFVKNVSNPSRKYEGIIFRNTEIDPQNFESLSKPSAIHWDKIQETKE
jgi:hypothetical protein